MSKNILETLTGFIVLLIAGGFVAVAYKGASIETTDGYSLQAKFDRVDGLGVGGDVRISGIKVGNVAEQYIDPKTYSAIVKVQIRNDIKVPDDSTAEIVSDGLLGGKYFALVPGGSETNLKDGETIRFTQSSVSIEQLIGKFIFNGDDKKDKGADAAAKTDKKPEDIF
jgi:phospholipid/cholesterol/gamma-HCH transport system substrate-binding protein